MAAKRILLFDGARLLAYRADKERIEAEHVFAAEQAGYAAFAAYLGEHPNSLFHLLADCVEESFQLENLPAVRGADRDALLTRRLGQYFYGTPFSTAISLGRASSGRRDEKILFAALTRPETLSPWLEILRQQGAILVGVYSTPLVLASHAPNWLADQQPILLITLTAAGIRQNFFDQGRLRFSRLTPIVSRDPVDIARASAGEAGKTHLYLVGQRQISRETPLRVVTLLPPSMRQAIRDHCRDNAEMRFELLDLAAIARREKFAARGEALTTDALLMHLLVRKAPPQQFAPAAERHFFRLWQMRFALHAAAVVVLFGGLLFAAKSWLDTQTQQQDIATLQTRTALASRQYDQLIGSLPKIDLSPDNLRTLMNRYAELEKYSPEMTPLLAHLSHALDDMPQIELLDIDWEIAPQLKVGAGETAPTTAITAAMTAATPGSGAAPAAGPWAALTLHAQLPPTLTADLRAQKNLIDAFAKHLQDPRTTVRVLAMPFEVESAKPLKSLTETDAARGGQTTRFSLLIARPL